jgi:hypothetical protein
MYILTAHRGGKLTSGARGGSPGSPHLSIFFFTADLQIKSVYSTHSLLYPGVVARMVIYQARR